MIPTSEIDGVRASVICGTALGVTGPVSPNTPVEYIDFWFKSKAQLYQPVQKGWNTFVYVYKGSLEINGSVLEEDSAVFFGTAEENSGIEFMNGEHEAKLIWMSGQPLKEPIVQYGPFVMNTAEQIDQTLEDVREAKNGFENIKNWSSGHKKD